MKEGYYWALFNHQLQLIEIYRVAAGSSKFVFVQFGDVTEYDIAALDKILDAVYPPTKILVHKSDIPPGNAEGFELDDNDNLIVD